jgi:opacity protein-like surface antigen
MRIQLLSAALLASSIATAATPVNGWYTSVFGGYTFITDNVENTFDGLIVNQTGYNSGYNVGGRIGYQSNPIRYEGEYTFLYTGLRHYAVNRVEQTPISGFASANLLMVNIYYDFPEMLPAISPFLGGGIGYALLQASLYGIGPTSTQSYFSISNNAFAYQGTAGVTYNFAENFAVNLAYRYVATDKPRDFGRVFQAHLASAGAVYRFDYGNYK